MFNLTGGSEYKNKVENTKCHFPARNVWYLHMDSSSSGQALVCVLVCVCERSSCVGIAAILELECR